MLGPHPSRSGDIPPEVPDRTRGRRVSALGPAEKRTPTTNCRRGRNRRDSTLQLRRRLFCSRRRRATCIRTGSVRVSGQSLHDIQLPGTWHVLGAGSRVHFLHDGRLRHSDADIFRTAAAEYVASGRTFPSGIQPEYLGRAANAERGERGTAFDRCRRQHRCALERNLQWAGPS